jgi:hypothetical protein
MLTFIVSFPIILTIISNGRIIKSGINGIQLQIHIINSTQTNGLCWDKVLDDFIAPGGVFNP